jgi:hypothetical protein
MTTSIINDFTQLATELKRVEAEKAKVRATPAPEQPAEYTFSYPSTYYAPDDYMA